jgi:hypothetical protein
MVLCAMAGVNAVAQQSGQQAGQQAAQEFLWDGRGRAPLGTVPVRYVPISAQQHPFQTWHNFPWSSSATVRVSTSAILSITPNASTGSSRGQRTRVEFTLSSEAVFRRVIGVFFGNKMARAFNVQEAELGKPRVIAALVDSMAANTGYGNGFRTTAGVILEREKDTLIAYAGFTYVDSTLTNEDRQEEARYRLRQRLIAANVQPEINFFPTGGDEHSDLTISYVTASSPYSFDYKTDSLELEVTGVAIGGMPVKDWRLVNSHTIRARPGVVRSGEVTVSVRRREISTNIFIPGVGTLTPAQFATLVLPPNVGPGGTLIPTTGTVTTTTGTGRGRNPRTPAPMPRDTTPRVMLPSRVDFNTRREFMTELYSFSRYLYLGKYTLPEITDFTPKSGNSRTTLTITGRDFDTTRQYQVWVGGVLAGDVEVLSPTQMRVRIGNTVAANATRPMVDSSGYLVLSTNDPNATEWNQRVLNNGVELRLPNYPNATLIVPDDASGPIRIVPDFNIKPLDDNLSPQSVDNNLFTQSPPSLGHFRFVAPSVTIASISPTFGSEGDNIRIRGAANVDYTKVRNVTICGVTAASFTIDSPTQITARLGGINFVRGQLTGKVKLLAPGRYAPNVDSTLRRRGVRTDVDSLVGSSDEDFTFIQRVFPTTIQRFAPTSGGAGTTVVITGTGFGTVRQVFIGGVQARSFKIDSPTQITAVVNSGGIARVALEITLVTGADLLGRTLSEEKFVYLETATPPPAMSGQTAPTAETGENAAQATNTTTNQALTLYPNPVLGELAISGVNNSGSNVQVRVYDVLGNVVLSHTATGVQGAFVLTINMVSLPQGIYTLRMQFDGATVVRRVIKQ